MPQRTTNFTSLLFTDKIPELTGDDEIAKDNEFKTDSEAEYEKKLHSWHPKTHIEQLLQEPKL